MHRMRRTIGLLAVTALVFTACTNGTTSQSTLPGGTTPQPNAVRTAGSLVQFDACDEFLDYVVDHALDLVGPYGLGQDQLWGWIGRDFAAAEQATDGATVTTNVAAGGTDFDFSQTNVQVEGVDEPDIAKTDGKRIVLIANHELVVVDVTGDEPRVQGRMPLGEMSVSSIFLSGDKVLAFGSVWSHHPVPFIEDDIAFAPDSWSSPTIQIVEIDIESDPEIVQTMTIDGSFISGRMIDDTVRLVMTSGPVGFEWSYPEGSGLRAERRAVDENKDILRNSEPENWIPYYIVTDADGDVVSEGPLFECERAAHPEDFSGLDMLSVVTIDLADGLEVKDATGVLATGQTVYASPDSLYVATQNWQTQRWLLEGDEEALDGPITEIHKFDISDPTVANYEASGTVEGYLLNQFAMDEHRGDLRVASTTTPNWWGAGPDSESRVTILRDFGDNLVPIGVVDGLGETEQIFSVRFMGDVGYVVTFRQTDPLYTIDLSDHSQPKMVGELKILGYSAYLHPIADGLLMGVGQDATEEGRVTGTQVSIFDVSDLENPTRIDTHTMSEGSHSDVEWDHHAFLYWDGLAMIPFQQWWYDDEGEGVVMGALGLSVSEDGELSEVGTVSHPGADKWDYNAQIQRSIVIGDSIYTIAPGGIMKSSLEDLEEQAFLDF